MTSPPPRVILLLDLTANRRFRLGLNATWVDAGGDEARLIGLESGVDGIIAVLEVGDEQYRQPFREALRQALADAASRVEVGNAEPRTARFEALAPEVQARVLELARHLRQAQTGSPRRGGPLPGEDLDPKYDPAQVPQLTQRLRNKYEELGRHAHLSGISPESLFRKLQLLNDGGVEALVPLRELKQADAVAGVDSRIIATIQQVIHKQTNESTKQKETLDALVLAALEELGPLHDAEGNEIPLPSVARQRKITALLKRGLSVHAPAKSRRNAANRPEPPYGGFTATRPGEVVQVDMTPTNLKGFDPRVGYVPVDALMAVDIFDSRILALRLAPSTHSSRDTALLLWDILSPLARRLEWPPGRSATEGRPCGMPTIVALPPELHPSHGPVVRRMPGPREDGVAGFRAREIHTVVIDHGSTFDCEHFLSACSRNRITAIFGRPGTPTDKPAIESANNFIAKVAQHLPGFQGANVAERGANPEKDVVLPINLLQQAFQEAVFYIHNALPNKGCRLPGIPNVRYSPDQFFDLFVRNGPYIELPVDPRRIFDFLHTEERVIGDEGVSIGGLLYDDPVLSDFRKQTQGGQGEEAHPMPFHWDRDDRSCIYFYHPERGEYYRIPARRNGRPVAPFSEVTLRAAIRQEVAGGRTGTHLTPKEKIQALAKMTRRWADNLFRDEREKRVAAIADAKMAVASLDRDTWDLDELLGDADDAAAKEVVAASDQAVQTAEDDPAESQWEDYLDSVEADFDYDGDDLLTSGLAI